MDEVIIVEYNLNWVLLFEKEAANIRAVLDGDLITQIEHFGSTILLNAVRAIAKRTQWVRRNT
jgi:GrpB-like predicted nucleotidyltransferase (UPF0157 family)